MPPPLRGSWPFCLSAVTLGVAAFALEVFDGFGRFGALGAFALFPLPSGAFVREPWPIPLSRAVAATLPLPALLSAAGRGFTCSIDPLP